MFTSVENIIGVHKFSASWQMQLAFLLALQHFSMIAITACVTATAHSGTLMRAGGREPSKELLGESHDFIINKNLGISIVNLTCRLATRGSLF